MTDDEAAAVVGELAGAVYNQVWVAFTGQQGTKAAKHRTAMAAKAVLEGLTGHEVTVEKALEIAEGPMSLE